MLTTPSIFRQSERLAVASDQRAATSFRSALFSLFVVAFLCACTSTGEEALTTTDRQPLELLSGDVFFRDDDPPPLPNYDILGLDRVARKFIWDKVDNHKRLAGRLDDLLDGVVNEHSFGLQYDGRTRTALETFYERNGNCLAFTNMFVAMAREVGLDARFQEVKVPPTWDRQGELVVLNKHINVSIENVSGGDRIGLRTVWGKRTPNGRVVDFNIRDFRSFYRRELITDQRAHAHFFSNVGVERLRDGAPGEAFLLFRRAIELDQNFAPAWTNLGVLYSRSGYLSEAEVAYRHSLQLDDSVSTRANLAALLERMGNTKEAAELAIEVARYRSRNPYYRYSVALREIASGELAKAENHLRYAIKQVPLEHTFWHAMGVVASRQGDEEAAQDYLQEAQRLSENPVLKQYYNQKIRLLSARES